MDRFLQEVLATKGYTTARALPDGAVGDLRVLVRQGGLIANSVREVTPLEAGSTKRARAMDAEQITGWLSVVDASEAALRPLPRSIGIVW